MIKEWIKEIKARPSAISTNALGSIAAPFSTMATFLILLLSPNISDQADHSINDKQPWLEKGTRGSPHWQSYNFRTSWYK